MNVLAELRNRVRLLKAELHALWLAYLLGTIVLLISSLGLLWFLAVRYEQSIRVRWHKLRDHPRASAFRKRFAWQLVFLKNRLTPGGYLGLHLTVGSLAIILTSWWFGGIAEDLIERDTLIQVDQQLSEWLHESATPGLTSVARWVTGLGSSEFLTPATFLVAAWFGWRRSWHRLLTWAFVMGGGILLNLALKALFRRPRPIFENPFVTLDNYSFPSGHTMGATLFYGTLALFVILVGIDVDEIMESFHKKGQLFLADAGKALKEFREGLAADIQNARYSREVEEGILRFVDDVVPKKLEIGLIEFSLGSSQ